MNYIQTLSFDKSTNPFEYSFGWIAPEYHLMGWALSCLQLHSVYKKVDLYADSNAATLLIEKLKLPYRNVCITHDNLLLPDKSLWALPKVFSYSLQKEPFIHFDGDVFLFTELPPQFLNCELVAQNIELATDYSLMTQAQIIKEFSYFPACIKADFDSLLPIKAVNAGILGGNNVEFIQEYSGLAFEYINRNAGNLSQINVDGFNSFFEQHLFYSMAKQKGIPIDVLLDEIIKDNEYRGLDEFHKIPFGKGYLHLLGHYKRDAFTCRQMAAKLRELYPEYYYRIIELCKKNNTPISINLYYDKKFVALNDYVVFDEHAKDNYTQSLLEENLDCSAVRVPSQISVLETAEFLILQEMITDTDHASKPYQKSQLDKDLKIFAEKIGEFLLHSYKFSIGYLYGRDLKYSDWFSSLFAVESEILNKKIARCAEGNILKSGFDWTGLINKHKYNGARYYENLELEQGEYYSLIIPEIYKNGFSLHDLDDMEKIILDHLSEPVSINILLCQLQQYVDEDVVSNHLPEYNNLLIVLIKQLVLKKAIRPYENLVLNNE